MAVDEDDIRWFHLEYAHEDLERMASRLSDPTRAYDRWWDVVHALVMARVLDRITLDELLALASRMVLIELRRAL